MNTNVDISNLKTYDMKGQMGVADQAAEDITKYLKSLPETIGVINVEDDWYYRKKDIDLLWVYRLNGKEKVKKLEIKGDRYSRTGNFFLETVSNKEKGTPGCFMYTEADFVYYYFVDTKEVNIMPVEKTRKWFLDNIDRFEEKKLATKVREGIYYTSLGRLVPKEVMRNEIGTKYKVIA